MEKLRQPTSYQERLAIIELTQAGQTLAATAQSLDRSYYTVRKWQRRAKARGPGGLLVKIGRPASGQLSSFPKELAQDILRMRQAHPGWGAATLRTELAHQEPWRDQPLPSVATLNRFLKGRGLIASRRTTVHSPQPTQPPTATRPHQIWELDAQGETTVSGLGKVAPINLIDTFSRLKVESYPTSHSRQPRLEDYQLALRRAFSQFGLPEYLSLDHGPVFFDNSTNPPFPTRLVLWLRGLSIEVVFSRKGRPTDHARVERDHQTIEAQALVGQSYPSLTQLWQSLDGRRERLNQLLPCRSLGGLSPLQAYPGAAHSGRFYRPEWEAEMLDLGQIYEYLASQPTWFRQVRPGGSVWLGGYEYVVGRALAGKTVAISFEPLEGCLHFAAQGENEVVKKAICGLSQAELMGELGAWQALPAYQLALPFEPKAWRSLEYANAFG